MIEKYISSWTRSVAGCCDTLVLVARETTDVELSPRSVQRWPSGSDALDDMSICCGIEKLVHSSIHSAEPVSVSGYSAGHEALISFPPLWVSPSSL